MKKSTIYLFSFIGVLLLTLVGVYVMEDRKIEAYAMSMIYEGEPYPVQFTSALKESSVTDGTVTVVNADGQTVEAELTLSESGKELVVMGLAAGTYTIEVKKAAFVTKTKFKRDRTFELEVMKPMTAFTSEEDLKAYFKKILERDNVSYGFAIAYSTTENAVASDSASGGGGGSRSSTTNNQVEGIEEGDIIITDGQAIYSAIENKVLITDAKNAKAMTVKGRIELKDGMSPTHLMKHNNLLIVVYAGYEEQTHGDYYDGKSVVKVAFYDVSDLANPKLVREIGQDGYTLGVRKMGDVLYIVSNQTPNYWLMRENVDVELRPAIYDGVTSDLLPIERIHPLPGSQEPNYLIVSALKLDDVANAEVTTESYLGNSGDMYMSEKAIYMTATNYGWMPFLGTFEPTGDRIMSSSMPSSSENETTIYKVAIDGTNIALAAEGKVKGHVLNQFSMDEHDGYFRIATTEGSAWGASADSTNTLYVLDGELKEVGKVAGLARGERIYSARFIGDKAYVVTFRETDPLFVIDVANPREPKVLGELKIPGFSNYLHPIGEHHLLGIGYDTKVTMQPGSKEPMVLTQGMKLSLFNVEDLENPIEQDTAIIGGRGTYSEVQHNHKALFRDEDNSYYGFPVTMYAPKGEFDVDYLGTGAQIYEVTTAGIELAADFVKPAAAGEQYERWEETIQRLLYIDDALYTVSREEIKSYELDGFKPISSVKLR